MEDDYRSAADEGGLKDWGCADERWRDDTTKNS